MAENKGKALLLTEVCQPIPGEDTFDSDDHIGAIRRDNPQERCGRGGQMLVDPLRPVLIENADVHRLGL
jgi:hypothetical protein